MDHPVPAIFFHPDMVEGAGKDLVGRRSAGTGFLNAWLAHSGAPEIRVVTDTPEHGQVLAQLLRDRGETRPLRATPLLGGGDFGDAGCVFFPAPSFQAAAWRRQRLGPERLSLVGLTHTVSTRRIIESLHALMSEPVEEWDAIICTSRAVRSVLARQFAAEAAYFRQRFGATRVPQPQLPVIPLGVDAAAFASRPGAREGFRAAQDAPPEAVVVMTMGRLSVVEKANPVPLMLALEEIARTFDRPLHLWLTGWASRPEEEALHREAAQLAPSVTVRLLDGRDPQVRRDAWAGADLFTLPSDSIQETFGLVPVEAMAAGLPVVMPDWDGFRDTVRHGETGFLVPTRMAPPGLGGQLARRFSDGTDAYLHHLTLVQAHVQIDVPAYARALGTLIRDPGLRARMGEAGRRHVAAHLDWSRIVPLYLDLARDLAERRRGATPTTPALAPGLPNPLEIDPFELYADYPSAALDGATPIHPGPQGGPGFLDINDRLSGRALYRRRVATPEMSLRVLRAVTKRPGLTVLDLARHLGLDPVTVASTVLVLAKADALRLPEPPLRRS
ncbi:glycosyltransferase family 4 protein [Rubellimicrobium roseum]|uniref:Glycosyltransferase family 4 protein n=1 Tax=Rubellimicrobium roseum TaxID=687525 RepID=A0A5C4NJT5_9RHOB|nr:glycosyltransferase family 4 protein [Rubellimicrobium roseum]TNC74230.1 glycosyltransferase family 4 protein [Rubellimicrobium roseum]